MLLSPRRHRRRGRGPGRGDRLLQAGARPHLRRDHGRCTARASRSTRSPSPRSCAAPTCSTLVGGPGRAARASRPSTPASANAGHYAKIVNELALLRRLIAVAGEIAEMGYDDARRRHRDARPRRVAGVRGRRAARVRLDGRRSTTRCRTRSTSSRALYGDDSDLTGVPTGYTDLDGILLGLQPSNLIDRSRPARAWARPRFALGVAAQRRHETRPAGRLLLDGDGHARAHQAPARGRGARRRQQAADGQAHRSRLDAAQPRGRPPRPRRRCSSTTTRTAR